MIQVERASAMRRARLDRIYKNLFTTLPSQGLNTLTDIHMPAAIIFLLTPLIPGAQLRGIIGAGDEVGDGGVPYAHKENNAYNY